MPKKTSVLEKQLYKCEVLSKVALEIGNLGNDQCNLTEELIYKYWDKEELLPHFRDISIGNIKWFLKEKIEWDDPVWSASFLQGLSKVGKVSYKKQTFPSLCWGGCPHVWDFINASPFGGKKYSSTSGPNYWRSVPALYLKGDVDSIEYVAGLMAGLQRIDNVHGVTYARISSALLPHIKALGIPIDYKGKSKGRIGQGISPIWPMLFEPYMPIKNKQWEKIKNPLNGELYATILWKAYVSNTFESKGIPFLPSRRTIFYRHKEDQEENGVQYHMGKRVGALKKLEKMRIEHDLIGLNKWVIAAIRNYSKKPINKS